MVVALTRGDADLFLWLLGGFAAVLSLFVLVRANWPKTSRVIAFPFRVLSWLLWFLLVRAPRWTWRQAWRDQQGNTRGPLTRLGGFARRWLAAAFEPQFAANRAAARDQHDEQNRKLAALDGKLDGIDGRLTAIEELVTTPRRRST